MRGLRGFAILQRRQQVRQLASWDGVHQQTLSHIDLAYVAAGQSPRLPLPASMTMLVAPVAAVVLICVVERARAAEAAHATESVTGAVDGGVRSSPLQ